MSTYLIEKSCEIWYIESDSDCNKNDLNKIQISKFQDCQRNIGKYIFLDY